MMISDVIAFAWSALRAEHYSKAGTYERRIFAASPFRIFATLERPSALKQLRFEFNLPIARLPSIELRGVILNGEVLPEGGLCVRLGLGTVQFEEVFTALAADVVAKVLDAPSEEAALNRLVVRLTHWQRFMEMADPDGLSPERQAGLFGELMLVRTLLKATADHEAIMMSWQGPQGTNQDFSRAGRAIEVKTTTGNSLDTLTIANEHQLDYTGLASLDLCHLCFDVRKDTGITLPTLVAEVSSLLSEELRVLFSDLLLQAGYLDGQKHIYADRGFIERRRIYYAVTEDFPRIVAAHLPEGIGRVSYQLNTSACTAFRRTEALVLKEFLTATS
jgi:Putative  PD-(D/E)XK family member, (DUF4420)